MSAPPITLDLTLASLLEHYPSADAALRDLAPAFAGLADPVLRGHITRATTIERAAIAAGVEPNEFLADLRVRLGRQAGEPARRELPLAPTACGCSGGHASTPPHTVDAAPPSWAATVGHPDRVIDADEILAKGESPLGAVAAAASELGPLGILAVRAAFRPTPMIHKFEAEGYATHCRTIGTGRFELLIRAAGSTTR